jgi:hypothetical protein
MATDSGTPHPSPSTRRSFVERVIAALRFDATVYEEVEHDPDALPQAAGVIALVAVAEGLAGVGAAGFSGLIGGVFSAGLGWVLGAGIIWLVGVKLMNHSSDFPELLRTLGFASVPKVLLVFGILPIGPLRGLLALGVNVAVLIAFVIAVRQALDVSTGRAVGICLLAFLVSLALSFVFAGTAALL